MDKRGRERGRLMLTLLMLAVAMATVMGWFGWRSARATAPMTLRYGDLIQTLRAARHDDRISIRRVQMSHSDIRGEIITTDRVSTGGEETSHEQVVRFRTTRLGFERDPEIYALLRDTPSAGYQGTEEESALRTVGNALLTLFVFVGMLLGLMFVLRWVSGGSALAFGKSRARLYGDEDDQVTFNDVAGIDEAVEELREVVDFLKKPEKYKVLGGRIPKGVLLVGPPGTGKTLLARAVAGEASVSFFSMSGSDFVELFVGVGASRVRDVFAKADSRAPCILFIDELDALGKTRSGAVVGGHEEREQTLNQLLVEMDGFDVNRGIIMMAATNRPETLDPALLRPGRFDRMVVVDRPDISGREAILKVHSRGIKLGPNVDLRKVASLTPGAVGADLANVVNEAALLAARAGREHVGMADFDEAIERGAVGLERKSRIMNGDEKQRVAYHEAGHALVSCVLPNTNPVHKISIIPRGVGALGYVLSRPEEDRYLTTQSELLSHIKVALGGTVSEELVYREISNGATNDLEQASDIARKMVKQFGMSRLGRVCYQERNGSAFLDGAGMPEYDRAYSEQTAREIDLEVRKIIEEATTFVRDLLEARRDALEAIARRLMEKEAMDSRQLRELLAPFGIAVRGPERAAEEVPSMAESAVTGA